MQSCIKLDQGAMAAILGLSVLDVEEILGNYSGAGVCQIANDNDPKQVVISGHRSAVDAMIELAKKKGARRALPLNVSAPFHCDIMVPAALIMQEAISDVKISRPLVPVVMNTLAEAITDPEKIRMQLVNQITARVRWRETIHFMHRQGTTIFYEVGVGNVLSGMVKRTLSNIQTVGVSSYDEIKMAMESGF